MNNKTKMKKKKRLSYIPQTSEIWDLFGRSRDVLLSTIGSS
jgi:hypothetical protein